MSTATPGTSKDVLTKIREPWMNFRLAAVAIGLDGLEARTSAGWTFKQMLAHVGAWHDLTARRLRALRESGEPLDPPESDDADAFNARVASAASARPIEEVLAELDASAKAVSAEVEQLTDEQLAARDGWAAAVIAGNTYGHYAEHHDELFAAVPATRRDLEAKVEESWRRFRAAVAAADLERTTAVGWTGKALVVHAARWLEHLAPELALRLEGKRSAPPDIQAENERSIAAARDTTPAAAMVRLDAGYDAVLATLRRLATDAEVPFLAIRAVAAETYAHFREHQSELAEIRR